MKQGAALLATIVLASACASTEKLTPTWPGSHLIVLEKEGARAVVVDPIGGIVKHVFPTETGPHEVAVSRNGEFAVVANYGDGPTKGHTLSVFNLVENHRERLIDLAPHERPHGIAFLDRRSTVLVTSETSGAVLEVDLRSGKVTRVMPTGAQTSHMLALSYDKKRVYTANIKSGTVSVIDVESGALVKQVPTGAEPEAIDVAPNGEIWVGHNADDKVVVIDPRTLEVVATIGDLRMPIRLAAAQNGEFVAVSCAASGELALIDAQSRTVTARIPFAKLDPPPQETPPGFDAGSPVPCGVVLEPDSLFAFVSLVAADKVAVVDIKERRVRGTIAAPGGPDGLAWAFRREAPRRD
jgi:YVTN family beta-propeller protein